MRLSLHITGIWLLLLLYSGCGGGGTAPSTQPEPTLKTHFKFSGRVLDEAGNPIAHAIIHLSMLKATSAQDGSFEIPNVTGGTYNLSIQAPDGTFFSDLIQISSDVSQDFVLTPNPSTFAVIALSPLLDAKDVSLNNSIVLKFSAPVDRQSVMEEMFQLSPPVNSIMLKVSNDTVEVIPTHELKPAQNYRLTVKAGIRDITGRALPFDTIIYFTTSTTDNVPPEVVSTRPEQSAQKVSRNIQVMIEFTDELAEIDLQDAMQITVEPTADFDISIDGDTLLITFTSALLANTLYRLSVSKVKDDALNPSSEFTLSFTTGTQMDLFDDIEPDWVRIGNLIAFARKQGANYDLYTIDMNTRQISRLTETPFNERHPRFSSDGSFIVYQADAEGNWDVYVMDAQSRSIQRVTFSTEDEIQPDFSGTFLAQIAYVKRVGLQLPWKVFIANRDGSFEQEADPNFFRNEFEPSFHPLVDNQILFITDEGGDKDVYIKSLAGIEGETLNFNLTSSLASDESFAVWSPDGSTIAVLSNSGGKNDIWIFEPSGTVFFKLTNLTEDIHSFAFSPNPGDNVLVVSLGKTGSRHLALVSLTTGEIVDRLT